MRYSRLRRGDKDIYPDIINQEGAVLACCIDLECYIDKEAIVGREENL